jgi:uncharacterized protein (DUF1501 family)
MDGLDVVSRPDDSAWRALGRQPIAGSMPLTDGFALHGALSPIHGWWKEGALAVVPAVGQPAARRSHFDAQDLMEEGGASLGMVPTGWLHRALVAAGAPDGGAAIGSGLPLVLRGEDGGGAASVDPSREPEIDEATLDAVAALWRDDATLSAALAEASRARSMGSAPEEQGGEMGDSEEGPKGRALVAQAEGAGRLLAGDEGYRVAVLEGLGWDTHATESIRLPKLLADLAKGLVALREGLGDRWANTVVVTATEFGRTARPNGTQGTDHGTATATLLAGGALRGGRIHGDWPGLSKLFEDRDLSIATDVRAVFKGILGEHLGISRTDLDRTVFPGSEGIAPMDGLLG